MRDFFISYNRAERPWAEWIAWELEEAGYSTILQAWDFCPGSNFVLDMQKAAADSDRTLGVLSPDYLAAEFTQPEWAAAFAKDPTGKDRKLVFVRVRECKPQGLLPQNVYIDLVGLPEDRARKALLDGLKPGRAKPDAKPAFPGTAAAERAVAEKPPFPGGLPAIWNVPHRRNPNFTGREELLAALGEALAAGGSAALTQAISGLGGVGKTQLAVEYVYRHLSDYDIIWWVASEEPAKRAADFAALAVPLDLREKDSPNQPEIVAAVRRELDRRSRWLLVSDNAGGPEDLADYLPQGATGHVIVTSRNPAWGTVGKALSVKVWPREESLQFLLKRTSDKDEKAADALADALGDLPLALEHAAAYVEQAGCSLAHYQDLYDKQGKELRRRAKVPTGYEATVATTWEISFREVQKSNPAAGDLLNLCAFLAPDNIPLDILCAKAQHLPKRLAAAMRDSLALDDAVGALRRYSLVEVAGEALSVHRLVQTVARDRLAKKPWRVFATAAVEAVNSAFPLHSEDIRTWPLCSRLFPHALASTALAEAGKVAPLATAAVLNRVGPYLLGMAQLHRAEVVLRRATMIAEAALGLIDPNLSVILNNLGMVLKAAGNMPAAKQQYSRALRILEGAFGENHPGLASILNNLGLVLLEMRKPEEGKAHVARALAIDLESLGHHHPDVGRDTNNLGMILKSLGDLPGAKAQYERALPILEDTLGRDHPNVGMLLSNLGSVLFELNDPSGAKKHVERALSIHKAAFGSNHPAVAADLNNLGMVLQGMGDPEGARRRYKRALGIFRQFLGEEHPHTKLVKGHLEALEERGVR